MSSIKCYYTIEIFDRDGKRIKKYKRLCKSFLKQFADALHVMMTTDTSHAMIDTSNTSRNVTHSYTSNLNVDGDANDDTRGIVIGTDDTAVDVENYNLGALIAHGSAAGEMLYQAQSEPVQPTVDGSTAYFTFLRSFYNDSGDTINVKEIGLIGIMLSGATPYDFLFIRDVLASQDAVADGQAIAVTYTIKVTA